MVEEFKTKYGAVIPKELLVQYFERVTNKIFKCLPAMEEGSATLSIYIEYLLIELAGGNELIYKDVLFLELITNLEAVVNLMDNYPKYRSQVLKCTNICKKIIHKIKEGSETDGLQIV
jgi:hypothetical protein